jgi:demethoxyubiquinone hydroxylase (CLK1/Coq7/Cat5 family)
MRSQLTAGGAEHDTVTCDIDVLNALLRGEVAAAGAYDQVLAKFDGQPQAVELQRIRDEHTEAAAVLRERVRHFGGDPSEGSGVWGKLTFAITGTAKIFGPAAALGTLKQGEEYGIGQYENALTDPEVDSEDKDLIRHRLLPRCNSHVAALDRMIEAVKK